VVKRRAPRLRLGLVAATFAISLVGAAVVAPVILSSAAAAVEAAVGQAEAQQGQLTTDTAALTAQISSLSSPQRVAEEAERLGLVPADQVSYMSSQTQELASEGETIVAGR
jgi:cell division protein FtsB